MQHRSCAGSQRDGRLGSRHVCQRRDVFSAGASHYGVADCELLAQVWPFALPDLVMALALTPCTALLE